MTKDLKVNDNIRAKQVRVVTDEGSFVTSTRDAINRAKQQGMDLIEINPNADVPVCKIMDYGKYKFDLSKREKELAKKARQAQIEVKELQLRPVTDDNDISIKARKAQGFLKDGDKVKVIIKFRGREMSHMEIGKSVMNKFTSGLVDYKVERQPTINGRDMIMILAPEKVKE